MPRQTSPSKKKKTNVIPDVIVLIFLITAVVLILTHHARSRQNEAAVKEGREYLAQMDSVKPESVEAVIKQHKLDMKLVDVEYTFDARKILFYFTAAERVDFRDLVKDLAVQFHTRIELRQIGVRDEARMDGGYGICGRPYCCATFLTDFSPVSIKMAKDQNLSLSPSKISGTCGRLMCCLRYEESTYEELTRGLPQEGDIIETPKGTGEVLHVNVLRQLIKVGIAGKDKDDGEISEFPLSDITILKRGRRSRSRQEDQPLASDDAASLKELEKPN